MVDHGPGALKRLLVIVAWCFGLGVLVLLVGGTAFCFAMKVEKISTQVVVPELAGMGGEDARRSTRSQDLVLEVVDQRHDSVVPSGRVLQQDPPAGASVRRGRKVKVVISLGGTVLKVPDLVGHAARQVAIELSHEGLSPGDDARVFSFEAPEGSVLSQVPPSGSPAVPGMRVHRLVSYGPRPGRWVMPDLAGRSRTVAEGWIEMCGFRRGRVRRVGATGRSTDIVVGQMPLAGYPIRAKDVVELTVAQ